MKALRFIADYWYVPFLVVGATIVVVLWYRGRGGPPPLTFETVKRELKAIDMSRKAREMEIDFGTESATRKVKAQYAEQFRQLKDHEQEQLKELENNPAALAKKLERLTRS